MTKLLVYNIFGKNKRFLPPAINGLGVEMTWRWDVLCRRRWVNLYLEPSSSSPKLNSTLDVISTPDTGRGRNLSKITEKQITVKFTVKYIILSKVLSCTDKKSIRLNIIIL